LGNFIPHAGCPRSHFTFLVLQLYACQLETSAGECRGCIRFAAHRNWSFPLGRGSALAAVDDIFSAGALIAPRMRIRRVVRQLRSSIGTQDLLVGGAVGRWCCAHGEDAIAASWLERAGVFGEAATEIWGTAPPHRGPRSTVIYLRRPPPRPLTGGIRRPTRYDFQYLFRRCISRRACFCRMRSTVAVPRDGGPLLLQGLAQRQLVRGV
jgi:hypothetical protein